MRPYQKPPEHKKPRLILGLSHDQVTELSKIRVAIGDHNVLDTDAYWLSHCERIIGKELVAAARRLDPDIAYHRTISDFSDPNCDDGMVYQFEWYVVPKLSKNTKV